MSDFNCSFKLIKVILNHAVWNDVLLTIHVWHVLNSDYLSVWIYHRGLLRSANVGVGLFLNMNVLLDITIHTSLERLLP